MDNTHQIKMKSLKVIILLASFPIILMGQKISFKQEINFFFDNTEFAGSHYTVDQTMAGVDLSPEIGINWDEEHTIFGGVNLLKQLGSSSVIDNLHFLAYYQFLDKNTFFRAGSFNKEQLFDDYSNFFFQDSVRFYRPTMNGLFLRKGNENRYYKVWLDWTGLQSTTIRESFFIGASAYHLYKNNIFADVQGYLFHYAGTRPSTIGQHVCDNLLVQTSLGYKYSKDNWEKILVSGGILAGFERNRENLNNYYTPIGFVGKLDMEYKQFGTENLLYTGQSRMKLYSDLGNAFYWGNPFLRGSFYLQNKLYWKVFDTKHVTGELASRQHFSQGNIYFEQLFTLSAKIGK